MVTSTLLVVFALALSSAVLSGPGEGAPRDIATGVEASAETVPVRNSGDAADDPAIWVAPDDPSQSVIVGTDKSADGALTVYDLEGRELHRYADGAHNNVDIRYDFELDGQPTDLVVSSDRAVDAIRVYTVDATDRRLQDLAPEPVALDFEPYGICLHATAGRVFAVVTAEDGGLVQVWELEDGRGGVTGRFVTEVELSTRVEGCVVDDEAGALYLSEEEVGIWRYAIAEGELTDPALLATVVEQGGDELVADIEGLALHAPADGPHYLVVSSQGSNDFVVYSLDPFAVAAVFAVVDGEIDGVQETDGIAVTSRPLGPSYPDGVFVSQDHRNDDGNQNFKLVDWRRIAQILE